VGSAGGTTSANQSICASETPTDIILTGYQGAIEWQVSPDNKTSPSTYTTITGATANTLTTPNMGSSTTTRYYRAQLSYGSCVQNYSTVSRIISYALPSAANAGADQSTCNNPAFTLAANQPESGKGLGAWTIVSGTATIAFPNFRNSGVSGIPAGTIATLRWTISNGTCPSSSDEILLTNYALSTAAYAGPDQYNCNTTTFTLAANPPTIGTGTWTLINGTGTITSPNSNTSGLTGVTAGTFARLRWTITNGMCNSQKDVYLYNYTAPTTATSGANQTNCNNSNFTMGANSVASGETGLWSLRSGAATITNPSSPISAVSLAEGATATLRWTITKTNGGCTSFKELVLIHTASPAPTAMAQSFCTDITISNLQAAGTAIQWYLAPTGGTALETSKALTSGNYYASQTINSCESSRTAVAISVYGRTWLGSSSSAWNTAANWTPALVPTANDCVVIPGGTTFKTLLESGANALAYNLVVKNGAELSIASGFTITLTDKLTVDSGGAFVLADSASLVQVSNGVPNQVDGTFTSIRNSQSMKALDYTYWGSPILSNSTKNLADLFTGSSLIYSWRPTINNLAGNWNREDPTSFMNPQLGYIVRAQSDGIQSVLFTGTPNNGTIEVKIDYGTMEASNNDKWNLIANPYPSSVSANLFLKLNQTSIDGTIYFWTHNTPMVFGAPSPFYQNFAYNYSANDYASYNGVGGTVTYGGTNSKSDPTNPMTKPNGNIASATGFFVKSLATGNSATFTNDMRSASQSNSQFFKTAPSTKTETTPLERHRIWLNLISTTDGFSQILIGYISGATLGKDRDFDGTKFGGNKVSFYSIISEGKLSIQGRPLPFAATDQVTLGYSTVANGDLTVLLDEIDGLFLNQNIYLEDKLTNTIHDMKASPYVFSSTAGTFNDRFVLGYTNNALANSDFANEISLTAFIAKTEFQVSASQAIENIEIYDLSGKLIQAQRTVKNREFKSTFPFAKGVYLAKIKLQNGIIVSKKLIN